MAVLGAPTASAAWSAEQREIVAAPVDVRLLVEAGPGTGKTAVACGRVAWLLDDAGVVGHEILLISFTRTAIAELRDRIEAMSKSQTEVLAVRLSTIDSNAWTLRHGFESAEAKLLGGAVTFDTNISRALELLRGRDPDLMEFLSRFRHVLIDEAQDVVGERAEFIVALLEALEATCGITVFADPAQAIYGWADEDDDPAATGKPPCNLLELLRNGRAAGLEPRPLSRVYRTENAGLLELLKKSRKTVLSHGPLPRERYADTKEQLAAYGDKAPPFATELLKTAPNSLVLCRRRVEVLQQSGFIPGPFRLRMSRLPCCIEPWVGHLLCEEISPTLARGAFDQLWQKRHRRELYPRTRDESWATLRSLAPDGSERINLRALRRMLARPKPPSEVCAPDVGNDGPVLGTIHASKGREADSVILALPHGGKQDETDWDEESRVLYVGASRAREQLRIARGGSPYAGYIGNSRVYQVAKPDAAALRAQVHIGMDGDVDPTAHVLWENAHIVQDRLAQLATDPPRITAVNNRDWGFRYRLFMGSDAGARNGLPLGQLAKWVNDDLFALASERGKGAGLVPPSFIPHLRILAVRTVCTGDDYDERIRQPYRDSRMFLAPVVHGFPVVTFFRSNRR